MIKTARHVLSTVPSDSSFSVPLVAQLDRAYAQLCSSEPIVIEMEGQPSPLAPTETPVPASPHQQRAENVSAAATVVASSIHAAGMGTTTADPGWPPSSSNQTAAAQPATTRPPEHYVPSVRGLKTRNQPVHLLGKAMRSTVIPAPDHMFTTEEVHLVLRRLFAISETAQTSWTT
jgi:hypothetical protein